MSEFWNKFWASLIKMSEKEMGHIEFMGLVELWVMLIIVVQLVALIKARLCREKRNLRKELLVILLGMYAIFMWVLAVQGRIRMPERIVRTNLLWFGSNMDDNTANLLNVVFFLPFGAMILLLQDREKGWRRILMTACYSFLMSFSIELQQYMLQCGYVELVDLETNTVGGVLGALCMIAVQKRLAEQRKKREAEE
ncbi:MAG: VanZ family protein [Lachnospiraceae bacterium]|nr:VanZ family protein [Lachnospiraceae bacterium]